MIDTGSYEIPVSITLFIYLFFFMKNITDDISTMYYIVVIVSTFQGERVTPMLHIPILKILSFDPGTTVTGWAMSTYTRSDRILTVHKCGEITPIKYAKKSSTNG